MSGARRGGRPGSASAGAGSAGEAGDGGGGGSGGGKRARAGAGAGGLAGATAEAEPEAETVADVALMSGAPAPDVTAFVAPTRVWLPVKATGALVAAVATATRARGVEVARYDDAKGLGAALAGGRGARAGELVLCDVASAARVRAALAGLAGAGLLVLGEAERGERGERGEGDEVPVLGPTPFGMWTRGRALELLATTVAPAPAQPLLPAEDVAVLATSAVLARELAGLLAARGVLPGSLLATGPGGLDVGALAWGLAAHGARPPRVIGILGELEADWLAPLAAAARRTRVVLLAPPARSRGSAGAVGSAGDALLRALLEAHGVALPAALEDWVECLVVMGAYDVPAGSRRRVDAEPGSAVDLAARAAGAPDVKPPVDVTLRAVGQDEDGRHGAAQAAAAGPSDGLVIPLVAGPGAAPAAALTRLAAAGTPALLGVWPALEAVHAAADVATRRQRGLGPAPADTRGRPGADRDHVLRTLERAVRLRPRWLSDHDTKIILKAYGLLPTRQAIAQSASAAARLAARVGWPCELRPHGPDLASEADGLLVVRNVRGVAEARRAFLACAKVSPLEQAIVRETPPPGVELRARVVTGGALGAWLELAVAREGAGAPLVAAPAPLRRADAQALAEDERILRRGRGELDLVALGDTLFRLSWLAFELGDRLEEIRLERLVVTAKARGGAGAGAIVVDARARIPARR